jgi:hypothetical protein
VARSRLGRLADVDLMGRCPTGHAWHQRREIAQAESDEVRMHLGTVCSSVSDELAHDGVRTSRNGEYGLGSIQQILSHERLYRTGIREWGSIEAQQTWPTIL